jgi:hypothetical protein
MMVGKVSVAFVVAQLLSCADGASTCTTAGEVTKPGDGFCEDDGLSLLQQLRVQQKDNYIAKLFPAGIATTKKLTVKKYTQIVDAIHDIYEKIDANVSANFNPRGSFVGCLLRTAAHDFMDFRVGGGGGSDGCVNLDDSDNAGIPECLERFEIPGLYKRFSRKVSLADFFVIIAEAAVGRTATGWSQENRWSSDSLEYRFRTSFKYGRETKTTCKFAMHRMPNPENGCEGRGEDKPGLKQIFVEHIFNGHEFPWTLTAAISGGHTIGSAKLKNSGYEGAWSSAEQMGKFNNDYFKRLIMASWGPERAVNGNAARNQWQLADANRDNSHKEMMLTTDMCLVYAYTPTRTKCEKDVLDTSIGYFGKSKSDYKDHQFFCRNLYEHIGPESPLRRSEGFVDLDPTKHMCCAWIAPLSLLGNRIFHHIPSYDKSTTLPLKSIAAASANRTYSHDLQWKNTRNEICGVDASSLNLAEKKNRAIPKKGCCRTRPAKVRMRDFEHECDNQYSSRGHAFHDVVDFAREEFLFYKWFVKAWNMATERGRDALHCVTKDCDVTRDALTAEEQQDCPMDSNRWTNPTEDDIKANPSCIARRIADTKTYHPDVGLVANTNWYRLNREAIPKELRSKGYDNYNFEDQFALHYKAGGATASSVGKLEFDRVKTLMPPENLIKFTTWKDDMEKNKTWNQVNNYKWTQDGRSSTCWSSSYEKDPWVSLKLTSHQRIHKVVVEGLYQGELAEKTLAGAQVWVVSGRNKMFQGATRSTLAQKRVSKRKQELQIGKNISKQQTRVSWRKRQLRGSQTSTPKALKGVAGATLCHGAPVFQPGKPTTVVCGAKPWGDEIVVTYKQSTKETRPRRLILCMVWPYRYDEEFSGIMNKKR